MLIIDILEIIEGNIDVLMIDPVMNRVYREMKEKFNSNIEDYKRLNSYLSHEQKNAMSILRTSLELEENKNLLGIINKVSNTVEDVLAISDTRNENEMYKIDVVLVCAQICDQYSLVYNNIIFRNGVRILALIHHCLFIILLFTNVFFFCMILV